FSKRRHRHHDHQLARRTDRRPQRVQSIVASFEQLVAEIDKAQANSEEKREAKSRLKALLSHPLLVQILGDVAVRLALH
ncbi:MAG: hypothetical protein U1E76_28750, partial [Planctomycetota bacterium]